MGKQASTCPQEASKAPEEGILQRMEGKGRGEKLFVNKVVRVC